MANNVTIVIAAKDTATEQLKKLVGELNSVNSSAAQMGNSAANAGTKFSSVLNSVKAAAGAAGTAIIAAMGKATFHTIDYTKEVMALSRQTGMSVEDSSKMKYAMQQTGAESANTAMAIKTLSTQIVAGKGAVYDYGIAVQDSNGKMLPTQQIIMNIADKLKSLPPGIERNAAAAKLFGRSWEDMSKMLSKGSEGVKKLGDDAERLGLVIRDTSAVQAYIQAQREWTAATNALQHSVSEALLPVMTRLTRLITTVTNEWNKLSDGTKKVIVDLAAIAGAIASVTFGIAGLTAALNVLGFSSLAANITKIAGACGAWAAKAALVVVPLVAIAGTAYIIYKAWDKFTAFYSSLFDAVIAYGKAFAYKLAYWISLPVLKIAETMTWLINKIPGLSGQFDDAVIAMRQTSAEMAMQANIAGSAAARSWTIAADAASNYDGQLNQMLNNALTSKWLGGIEEKAAEPVDSYISGYQGERPEKQKKGRSEAELLEDAQSKLRDIQAKLAQSAADAIGDTFAAQEAKIRNDYAKTIEELQNLTKVKGIDISAINATVKQASEVELAELTKLNNRKKEEIDKFVSDANIAYLKTSGQREAAAQAEYDNTIKQLAKERDNRIKMYGDVTAADKAYREQKKAAELQLNNELAENAKAALSVQQQISQLKYGNVTPDQSLALNELAIGKKEMYQQFGITDDTQSKLRSDIDELFRVKELIATGGVPADSIFGSLTYGVHQATAEWGQTFKLLSNLATAAINSVQQSFSSLISDVLTGDLQDFRTYLSSLWQGIASEFADMCSKMVVKFITSAETMEAVWSGLKSVGGWFSNLFPGFADGGDVKAGQTVVVTERGPEIFKPKGKGLPFLIPSAGPVLFTPPEDGEIIPNEDLPKYAGKFLAGARAEGGSVKVGHTYLTNERGVEGFVPASALAAGAGNVASMNNTNAGAKIDIKTEVTIINQGGEQNQQQQPTQNSMRELSNVIIGAVCEAFMLNTNNITVTAAAAIKGVS